VRATAPIERRPDVTTRAATAGANDAAGSPVIKPAGSDRGAIKAGSSRSPAAAAVEMDATSSRASTVAVDRPRRAERFVLKTDL
jgi:hypothetical protein